MCSVIRKRGFGEIRGKESGENFGESIKSPFSVTARGCKNLLYSEMRMEAKRSSGRGRSALPGPGGAAGPGAGGDLSSVCLKSFPPQRKKKKTNPKPETNHGSL